MGHSLAGRRRGVDRFLVVKLRDSELLHSGNKATDSLKGPGNVTDGPHHDRVESSTFRVFTTLITRRTLISATPSPDGIVNVDFANFPCVADRYFPEREDLILSSLPVDRNATVYRPRLAPGHPNFLPPFLLAGPTLLLGKQWVPAGP